MPLLLGAGNGGGSDYYFQDAFTGTSGTNISAHQPDIGLTWSSLAAGVVILKGGKARSTNADSIYVSSIGPKNYRIEVDINPGGNNFTGVAFRVVAANSFHILGTDLAGLWTAWKQVAGVWSSLASTNGGAPSGGSTYHLDVRVEGSTYILVVDGVERLSFVDTDHTTANNRFGIYNDYTDGTTMSQWDNFWVS